MIWMIVQEEFQASMKNKSKWQLHSRQTTVLSFKQWRYQEKKDFISGWRCKAGGAYWGGRHPALLLRLPARLKAKWSMVRCLRRPGKERRNNKRNWCGTWMAFFRCWSGHKSTLPWLTSVILKAFLILGKNCVHLTEFASVLKVMYVSITGLVKVFSYFLWLKRSIENCLTMQVSLEFFGAA